MTTNCSFAGSLIARFSSSSFAAGWILDGDAVGVLHALVHDVTCPCFAGSITTFWQFVESIAASLSLVIAPIITGPLFAVVIGSIAIAIVAFRAELAASMSGSFRPVTLAFIDCCSCILTSKPAARPVGVSVAAFIVVFPEQQWQIEYLRWLKWSH